MGHTKVPTPRIQGCGYNVRMGNLKKISRTVSTAEGAYSIATYVWPLVAPTLGAVMTMATGLLPELSVPLPYLFASSAVVFAGVATGMVRVNEWRTGTNPSGKLQPVVNLLYGVDINKEKSPKELEAIQFGFTVYNAADFPLYFTVEEISSEFMGRIPLSKDMNFKEIEVPAKGQGYWRDHKISLGVELPLSGSQIGELRYRVAYWKNPKKKFFLEKRYTVEAVFRDGSIGLSNHEK